MLKVKDFKETQELIDNGTLHTIKWRIFWNKDNNRIEVYETKDNGIRRVISSRQIKKKPNWVEWTIETVGEAKIIQNATSFRKRSLRSHNTKSRAQAHGSQRPLGANSEVGTATTQPLLDFGKQETARGQNKPSGLNHSEYGCCTAHRDEKKLSLPRHTRQLSRKNQLGDTNSATAYKRNTKRTGVTDRCGRNKREANKTPRKGAKHV